MLNEKWSKFIDDRKAYLDACNMLQNNIKALASNKSDSTTQRISDFVVLHSPKDKNFELESVDEEVDSNSIEIATQILKEVNQNTSLTYKELTGILNTTRSLIDLDESQQNSKHAQATLAHLQTLNTADSKRFYGLLMALAGVALIAASIALTVFTFGGALPLILASIPFAYPLITAGVVAVAGASLGALAIKTGLQNREEAEFDPITKKLSRQLKSGYLDNNKDVQDRLSRKEGFSRAFNHIKIPSDFNKDIYESLTKSAENGILQSHLQEIAKNMSRAFLDENHRLKPNIKNSLKLLNASQKEENQAIDELLKAAVTLYLLAATEHHGTITSKQSNERNEVFSHIISNPANLFNTTSGISKNSLFGGSNPRVKLSITNIDKFNSEIDRLTSFVQSKDIEQDKKEKIEDILNKNKGEMAAKINPCQVQIHGIGEGSYTEEINMPAKQKNELESMIPIQLSSEIERLHTWLVDEKKFSKEEIDAFEKTQSVDEDRKGPGSR